MSEINGGWAWGCGGARGMADERDQNEPAGERQVMPARFSRHALRRAARRNIVPDAVEYVLAYGRVVHRTGITFYFLAARDVPAADRRTSWAARLVGTVVLMGPDGEIITVYRNRRALPTIRRKLKYRLTLNSAKSASCATSHDQDEQPLTA